jgi:hypothetical protein
VGHVLRIVGLIALGDRFGLLEFGDGLVVGGARVGELILQRLLAGREIIAALRGGLGKGRIGEMTGIVDATPLLLSHHLVVQLLCHPVELSDHGFDLLDRAALLIHLEALQTQNAFSARLHRNVLPTRAGPDTAAGYSFPQFRRLERTRYESRAAGNLSFTSSVNHGPRSLNSG